jgi:hypothetical protein
MMGFPNDPSFYAEHTDANGETRPDQCQCFWENDHFEHTHWRCPIHRKDDRP